MTRIRRYRPDDVEAMAEICLLTADAGADATGVLDDDDLWANVFLFPYLTRHPEYAFVVENDASRLAGYVLGVPDTRAFEDWFAHAWWPARSVRWPRPGAEATRQDGILHYAYGRRAGAEPYGDTYPAHLHIDLLPELQGQGWGRRLIEALADALRADGVTGLHLVADQVNVSAIGFYTRLGFTPLPSHEGVQAFGMDLSRR